MNRKWFIACSGYNNLYVFYVFYVFVIYTILEARDKIFVDLALPRISAATTPL